MIPAVLTQRNHVYIIRDAVQYFIHNERGNKMSYEIKKGQEWADNRNGPRLDKFPLEALEVNDFFDIPVKVNAKGKVVPERGFNLKAANELHAPKVFKKKRRADESGDDVLRVQRVK